MNFLQKQHKFSFKNIQQQPVTQLLQQEGRYGLQAH